MEMWWSEKKNFHNFFYQQKKLIKKFKALTLPPAKRKSCNKPSSDLSLERYEKEDLDVLGDVGESKRKTFSDKT